MSITASSNRNEILDIFRGVTVALMVVVNNPGSWSHIYKPLRHPAWDGLSVADLVFPFFLLAVGISIPLAISSRTKRGDSDFQIFLHVLGRSLLLVLCGLFLNAYPEFSWENLRIPGVLQRIGVVYFFAYLIFRYISVKWQIMFVVISMSFYTYMTLYIPAWDIPVIGLFTYSPENHFGAALDRYLFPNHLWKYTKVYDPEGLFSTLPAIGHSIIGIWWIQILHRNNYMWGFVFFSLILGLALDYHLPINKTIWTPSFVFVTSSIGLGFYSLMGIFPTATFRIFGFTKRMGQHALFVFLLIGIGSRTLVMDWGGVVPKNYIWKECFSGMDPYLGSLLYSLVYLFIVWGVVWVYAKLRKART